jgi:hypothetical protein
MSTPAHRASDADREATGERLRQAAAEGRLDAEELDERLGAAYAARTVDDLAPLTADLPAPQAPAPPAPPSERSLQFRRRLAGFLTANIICIAVWLATGAGSFWPGWVLLGTGLGLVAPLVKTMLGVDDD